jgi:hypothetical protein
MEIWREGAREGGLGWDGGQRKERELKCRKVAGAGGDPLVKYRLACNHPGGSPVAGAPRRERYVASRAIRIGGASLARGISTF